MGGTSTFEGTFVSVAGSGPPDQLAAAGTAFTCTGPSCASPSAVSPVPPTRTVLVDARGKLSSGVTEIGGRGLSIELLTRLVREIREENRTKKERKRKRKEKKKAKKAKASSSKRRKRDR